MDTQHTFTFNTYICIYIAIQYIYVLSAIQNIQYNISNFIGINILKLFEKFYIFCFIMLHGLAWIIEVYLFLLFQISIFHIEDNMNFIFSIIVLLLSIAMVDTLYCQPNNCYELLEVSRTATQQQIKKSFRTLAKRHHPDRNRLQDTTSLFQLINLAYQILSNPNTRQAYDMFLSDPSGSRAYHTYQFYRASYSPQVNPFFVLISLILLLSWLQWVMRGQMYKSAIEGIVRSEGFRKRVNERVEADGRKGDKRYKEEIAEIMEQEISIQGGYSKPEIWDLLAVRVVMLPYTVVLGIKGAARWVWKYYIKREEYDQKDQSQITRKILKVPKAQWESMPEDMKKSYTVRKLWIKQNLINFQQQMKQKQLQQIKQTNPAKYRKIMSYLKKQQ